MAVIGSIRKRGTLLLLIIGGSLLLFVLGDALRNNSIFFSGPDNSIGTFNGEKVKVNVFISLLDARQKELEILQQRNIQPQELTTLRQNMWNTLIFRYVLLPQAQKTGIQLTKKELNDMQVGQTVAPVIKRNFSDPKTGQFNPQRVAQFVSNIKSANVPEEQKQQVMQMRVQWRVFLRSIKQNRWRKKYFAMLSNAVYVTKQEALHQYDAQNNRASIRYMSTKYLTIPDEDIKLSEDYLKEYYNNHQYKFLREKGRLIDIIIVNANPTAPDTAKILADISAISKQFKTAANDTHFVLVNSQENEGIKYYRAGELEPVFDSIFFNADTGVIVGPVLINTNFVTAKKLGEKTTPDSVFVRMVSFFAKTEAAVGQKRALRDSLFKALQNGADFIAINAKYSENTKIKKDSAKLGWITETSKFRPELIDSGFATETGSFAKLDIENTFHIIYVEKKTKPVEKVLVAKIFKEVVPSEETQRTGYAKASKFITGLQSEDLVTLRKEFTEQAQKQDIMLRKNILVRDGQNSISGIDDVNQLLQWIADTETKTGSISPVIKSDNNFIVALVVSVQEEGVPEFKQVRFAVEELALKHKKAEKIMSKYNSAMQSTSNIDQVSSALKIGVKSANSVTFASAFLPNGIGYEPKLVGAIFGAPKATMYGPLEGNSGVFLFVKDNVATTGKKQNIFQLQTQLMRQAKGKATTKIQNALIDEANIIDRRVEMGQM